MMETKYKSHPSVSNESSQACRLHSALNQTLIVNPSRTESHFFQVYLYTHYSLAICTYPPLLVLVLASVVCVRQIKWDRLLLYLIIENHPTEITKAVITTLQMHFICLSSAFNLIIRVIHCKRSTAHFN